MAEKFRVLVIDDSPSDAGLVEALLKEQGGSVVEVTTMSDLPVEVASVNAWHPDIVLLDLNLPGSRGMETVNRFLSNYPLLPLIVLTGLEDDIMAQQALRAGAQDYFKKDRLEQLPMIRLIRFAIERFHLNRRLKEYGEQLREQEARLRDVLESSPDGIMALDGDGKVSFANGVALRLLGRDSSTGVDEPVFFPGLDRRPVVEVSVDRDGSRRFLEVRRNDARWNGEDYNLVLIRDITDRKLYEDRLIEKERQELVDQLSAAIAHEFNNALAIIRMTGELLLMKEVGREEHDRHLEAMLGEVMRALDLVSRLTSLSRDAEVEFENFDLVRHFEINRVIYAKTLSDGVRLDLDVPTGLRAIHADANLLQQVFVNLLVNARHAMPDGGRMRISARNVGEDQVEVCFADTGCGIPPEIQKRIFEPFFTTKEVGKGTGIGLAMVRSVMQRHNGSVECESEPGKGTTFRLTFCKALNASKEAFALERDSLTPIAGEVVIVDDNALLCSLLEESLKARGHRVKSFERAEDLLEALAGNLRPDVILCDIVMPGMGGVELGKRVLEQFPECCLVYMTGYDLKSQLDSQNAVVLKKPFGIGDLEKTIQRELVRRGVDEMHAVGEKK